MTKEQKARCKPPSSYVRRNSTGIYLHLNSPYIIIILLILLCIAGVIVGSYLTIENFALIPLIRRILPQNAQVSDSEHVNTYSLGWLEAQAPPCGPYRERKVPSYDLRTSSNTIADEKLGTSQHVQQHKKLQIQVSTGLDNISKLLNRTDWCDQTHWHAIADEKRKQATARYIADLVHTSDNTYHTLSALILASHSLQTQYAHCVDTAEGVLDADEIGPAKIKLQTPCKRMLAWAFGRKSQEDDVVAAREERAFCKAALRRIDTGLEQAEHCQAYIQKLQSASMLARNEIAPQTAWYRHLIREISIIFERRIPRESYSGRSLRGEKRESEG